MARHDQHGLGDQAEPALLHDGGRHRQGLAGPDRMGEISRARRDDAPDPALLMRIKRKGAGSAWKLQMRAVEGARRDIVEAVVIDAQQTVGAIWVGPDPALEGVLDLLQL